MSYQIQKDGKLLSSLSVARGNVPRNVTVASEVVGDLGPGCHQLNLGASNVVTFPGVSMVLQVKQPQTFLVLIIKV